jgi:hypothetical protein
MKLHNYKKIFLSFTVLAICALAGCGDSETKKEVNAFLQQNGWEKIKGGSKEEINTQLFDVLRKHSFGLGNGATEERKQRQIGVAGFIVENEFYGTANNILSYDLYGDSGELILWLALMTDAMPEKSSEVIEFLDLFYQRMKNGKNEEELKYYFSYLMLYEAAPEIFEKINYEKDMRPSEAIVRAAIQTSPEFKKAITEHLTIQDAFYLNEAIVRAAIQASPEFRKTLTEQLTIQKAFPLSMADAILADFKPSNPQKGKYLFVYDDAPHELYKSRIDISDYFTKSIYEQNLSLYEAGILQPAEKLNEAQIIIYETYTYDFPDTYMSGYIYLLHTNVKVVNAVTGETIFNKTFESTGDEFYAFTGDYFVDDDYRAEEYAKQILEIVEKGL